MIDERRRTTYKITEKGRDVLEEYRRLYTKYTMDISNAMVPAVFAETGTDGP